MVWSVHTVAYVIFGAFFVLSSTAELIRWRKLEEGYRNWGYPRYWSIVTPVLKIVGGALVFCPPARLAGIVLCLLVTAAGNATIIYHREWKNLPHAAIPGLVIFIVAGVIFYTR